MLRLEKKSFESLLGSTNLCFVEIITKKELSKYHRWSKTARTGLKFCVAISQQETEIVVAAPGRFDPQWLQVISTRLGPECLDPNRHK